MYIPDLLQALEVVTELRVDVRRGDLRVLAITVVLLSVQEPLGHLELKRVLDDGDQLLDLIVGELSSATDARARSVLAS